MSMRRAQNICVQEHKVQYNYHYSVGWPESQFQPPKCTTMPEKVIIKCALLLSLGVLSFLEWNMPLSNPLPLPPPPDPFNKFKARSNLACARLLIGEKKQTSGPASNSRGQQQFPCITQMFIISRLLFCLSQSLEWVKSNRLGFDEQLNANIKCTSRHVTEIKPQVFTNDN